MILCHIVGINNKIKTTFLNEINNISNNINIIDIDDISKKIIFESEYNKLYEKYSIAQNKIQPLTKLTAYWKTRMTYEIEKQLKDFTNTYIIFIGMITFYLDMRVKLNLSTEITNKFFINTDTKTHIKNLIEHNIETYREDIINGKFPLKYLDYIFLQSHREQIRDIYMMKDYKLKSYNEIIQFIKNRIVIQKSGLSHPIYFASFTRYEDKIDFTSNKIIGYTDKWLSLISLFPRTKFKRGITLKDEQPRPYIKEMNLHDVKELNKCCYIYEMAPSKKVDEYRYLIEDNYFLKRYYVSNIKQELTMNDAIIELFKYDDCS